MLIVQKLYLKEFLKTLAILTFGIAAVFSIIGLVNRVGDFMQFNPSTAMLAQYTILGFPKYVHYLLPMAILLSSLFIFSQALKRREIVAVKSASGRMKKLLMPFVYTGLILTLFSFVIGELVVPASTKKMHQIKNRIIKKDKKHLFREGTLYMRGKNNSIVRVGLYLPDKNISKDVSIFIFDEAGLKERINAESAEWDEDAWILKKVSIQNIEKGRTTEKGSLRYDGMESPKIFQEEVWNTEEMTIQELFSYRKRLNEAGFKNVRLVVYINSRLSYPFINFFMLLLGISLSIGGEQKLFQRIHHSAILSGSRANVGIISAAIGLLISLAYWFGYALFLSLGYAGTVPPASAPWIVPAVFALISAYLYKEIPE